MVSSTRFLEGRIIHEQHRRDVRENTEKGEPARNGTMEGGERKTTMMMMMMMITIIIIIDMVIGKFTVPSYSVWMNRRTGLSVCVLTCYYLLL